MADPYRWLEDDTSQETAAWVQAQNKITFPYLDKIPYRDELRARVKQVNDYEKYTAPSLKGPYVFFRKNDGLQNQSVLYIQKGMTGKPEVLIDPNTWGETVALSTFVPSKDAKYAVYGISRSGSDWQEFKVMELATKKTLPDTVEWVKVSGAAWHGDGFFYSRYPTPEKGKEKASINEHHQVFFDTIGTPQSADVLVFEDKDNPQRFHTVDTTEDERFALLESLTAARARMATPCWFVICRRPRRRSGRCSEKSATPRMAFWITSRGTSSSRPTTKRRTGA